MRPYEIPYCIRVDAVTILLASLSRQSVTKTMANA